MKRPCTCSPPDDRPARCPHKYALTDCQMAAIVETSIAKLERRLNEILKPAGRTALNKAGREG